MRAVIIATGYRRELEPLIQHRPAPMLKIADKPILFHIIESLIPKGVSRIELILSYYPLMIEKQVDRGKRWGIPIEYHLIKEGKAPYGNIAFLAEQWQKETILLGQGDLLPELPPFKKEGAEEPTLFTWPSKRWSGWAALPADLLSTLHKIEREEQFIGSMPQHSKLKIVRPFLSSRSFLELKNSNRKVLERRPQGSLFPSTAKEVEKGVWISRGVALHPNVKIIPPVFIGDFCQILEGARIGPNSVIEKHCLIDHNSQIEESLICRHSYIGEGLSLQNSIVDRNLLVNLSLKTAVPIQDDFILSEIKSFDLHLRVLNGIKRAGALFLFLFFSPVYLYLRLTTRLTQKRVLKLPAPLQKELWKTYTLRKFKAKSSFQRFFERLPQLLNIISGEMDFIGVSPHEPQNVEKLPSDWKKLYLSTKTGLITLASLDYGKNPTEDERYASEAYYAVRMGLGQDLKILLRWLKQKWSRKRA